MKDLTSHEQLPADEGHNKRSSEDLCAQEP